MPDVLMRCKLDILHIWVSGCRVGISSDGWRKTHLNPELRVNLFYTGFFIRKVPLARFELWSNKILQGLEVGPCSATKR